MTAQHAIEMDDTGAALFSELLTAMRGSGAVGTTALECQRMAPAVLADIQQARTCARQRPRAYHKRCLPLVAEIASSTVYQGLQGPMLWARQNMLVGPNR